MLPKQRRLVLVGAVFDRFGVVAMAMNTTRQDFAIEMQHALGIARRHVPAARAFLTFLSREPADGGLKKKTIALEQVAASLSSGAHDEVDLDIELGQQIALGVLAPFAMVEL